MHSLAACKCPDWGLNPQPWHIRITVKPIELPRQDILCNYPKLTLKYMDTNKIDLKLLFSWLSSLHKCLIIGFVWTAVLKNTLRLN